MDIFLEKLRRAALILGWTALLVIVFATLSPIELRPHMPGLRPDGERFLAHLVAGGLLSFAYPRQRLFVLSGIIVTALGLEWFQTLEAIRHGRLHDAVVKVVGVCLGTGLAIPFERFMRRLRWVP